MRLAEASEKGQARRAAERVGSLLDTWSQTVPFYILPARE